jgi:hypothetical protein
MKELLKNTFGKPQGADSVKIQHQPTKSLVYW